MCPRENKKRGMSQNDCTRFFPLQLFLNVSLTVKKKISHSKASPDMAPEKSVYTSLNARLSVPPPTKGQASTLSNALLSSYSLAINYLHPITT